ncbi:TRAP transporter small permease subunit [Chloroflexota bacterium]
MDKFGRIIERVADFGGYFSGWLVPLMMILILFEVFMRYIMRQPPMVADEFSAYMLVALTYLGAAYTLKDKGHVRITALVSQLPARVSSWLRIFTIAINFIFTAFLAKAGFDLMIFSFQYHLASPSWLNVPLQGPQMPILIGFAILSILAGTELIKAIQLVLSGENLEGKGVIVEDNKA